MSAKDITRHVTHLEYLTTKEVFFHWKQSELGFSNFIVLCYVGSTQGGNREMELNNGSVDRLGAGVTSYTNAKV